MATMKLCTDLEQSKKLAEILSIESADMVYIDAGYCMRALPKDDIDANAYPILSPCWSLAALVDIFPCSKEELPSFTLTRGGWNPSFTRDWYAVWEEEDTVTSVNAVNSIDAVVGLIVKMKEAITKDMKQH